MGVFRSPELNADIFLTEQLKIKIEICLLLFVIVTL